ncbi:MAG: hypothetical protein MMC23_004302 [Stictis urceolatum]|nr:hypothetical protein [Stictis urceolata]
MLYYSTCGCGANFDVPWALSLSLLGSSPLVLETNFQFRDAAFLCPIHDFELRHEDYLLAKAAFRRAIAQKLQEIDCFAHHGLTVWQSLFDRYPQARLFHEAGKLLAAYEELRTRTVERVEQRLVWHQDRILRNAAPNGHFRRTLEQRTEATLRYLREREEREG